MAQRGRKRSTGNLPDHIQRDKLPTRTWFNKSGSGCWMLDWWDVTSSKWRSKKIAGSEASLSEIWQAVEANTQQPQSIATFKSLSGEFQSSMDWRQLSYSTQKDYLNCHKSIINAKTGTVLLGDLPLTQWTVGTVRKYRDFRGEESKSRANKELTYIGRVFSWAYAYEKVKFNPAKGIPKLKIPARQHYADDPDYQFLLTIARESAYWYMPYAMEIAYLCRMRLCEVTDLKDSNALHEGLLIKRRKGSKNNIVTWTEHLTALWQAATAKRDAIMQDRHQPHSQARYLFVSERTGDPIKPSTINTAKGRLDQQAKAKAIELGIDYTHFTFHDLKRKGISDTTGDKQEASGRRSAAMLAIYDVKPAVVKAAGEK